MKVQLSSDEIKAVLLDFCKKELKYNTDKVRLFAEENNLLAEFEVAINGTKKEETQV